MLDGYSTTARRAPPPLPAQLLALAPITTRLLSSKPFENKAKFRVQCHRLEFNVATLEARVRYLLAQSNAGGLADGQQEGGGRVADADYNASLSSEPYRLAPARTTLGTCAT